MLAGLLALKDLTLSALQLVLCGGIDWTGFFSLDAGVMSSVCPGALKSRGWGHLIGQGVTLSRMLYSKQDCSRVI